MNDKWIESLWVRIKWQANLGDTVVSVYYRPSNREKEVNVAFYRQIKVASWSLVLEKSSLAWLRKLECSALSASWYRSQSWRSVLIPGNPGLLFFYPKRQHISLWLSEGCIFNFFFDGEFTSSSWGLPFWLWLIVVTSYLITGNDTIQETSVSCWFSRSWQASIQCFFLGLTW